MATPGAFGLTVARRTGEAPCAGGAPARVSSEATSATRVLDNEDPIAHRAAHDGDRLDDVMEQEIWQKQRPGASVGQVMEVRRDEPVLHRPEAMGEQHREHEAREHVVLPFPEDPRD